MPIDKISSTRTSTKAFSGVGAIHISEVMPTLENLARQLDMSEISKNPLGSTGKKEYSNDIDIALNITDNTERSKLMSLLREMLGYENVRSIASIIISRVPIENYDESKDAVQPRTGFVQIDFMFGDVEWMKTFYHSPSTEESKFKGVHRNLAISALTQMTDREESEERDSFGRPITTIRWKWSPFGLIKVKRTSRRNVRTGNWVKKQDDIQLEQPIKDANKVAAVLFNGQGNVNNISSLESIIDMVKKVFPPCDQKDFFERVASNINDKNLLGDWKYPKEIAKYMS